MARNTNSGASRQESSGTDSEANSVLTRRDVLSAVPGVAIAPTAADALAADVAAQYDGEDYALENADEWEPVGTGTYRTGRIGPRGITIDGCGPMADFRIDDSALTEREGEVWYRSDGVYIGVDGRGDGDSYADADVITGATVTLDPDDARKLAAAIYQAAEELDRRPSADTEGSA